MFETTMMTTKATSAATESMFTTDEERTPSTLTMVVVAMTIAAIG